MDEKHSDCAERIISNIAKVFVGKVNVNQKQLILTSQASVHALVRTNLKGLFRLER